MLLVCLKLIDRFKLYVLLLVLTVWLHSSVSTAFALEPVPRQWNHLPQDVNFLGAAYAYTEADTGFDPVLRLEDVKMERDTWAFKYIRTFDVFEKSARVDITQAYQEARWEGLLNGAPASTSRHGPSDTFVRFAVNLYGAPSLSGKEYMAYRHNTDTETIIGAGLAVRLPTGDYQEEKLLNLGQNRFAFRPQLGFMHTRGNWTVDLTSEVAFYTENDEFFGGNKLEQDPLFIIYGSLTYTLSPGHWLAASVGYDTGGESTINGVDSDDHREDTGWALTYAYPLSRSAGIQFSYIHTQTLESLGNDTDTLAAGLAISW